MPIFPPILVASGSDLNVIASTPGATVWGGFANFFADFKENPSTGWSHVLHHLHSLDEVVLGLRKARLENGVSHLALVAHNDSGRAGRVPLGQVIAWNDPPAVATFKKLEPFLRTDAMLSLFVCISGAGREGDALLKGISKHLPGRTVVGFCMYVQVGKGGGNDPGNACGTPEFNGSCSKVVDPLTPWGKAAKRARDGVIVHVPYLERNPPDFKCANPRCPGHKTRGDEKEEREYNCDGW
jgi:hypothetical protein